MADDKRNLTDADVEAVVEALHHRIKAQFYEDLGRGVFSLLWKAAITIAVAVAAYGSHAGWWR